MPPARAFEIGFYPVTLVASLAASAAALRAGVGPGTVVAVNGLVMALLCLGFERVLPETAHWSLDPIELRSDVLHATLTNTIPTGLFRIAFQSALVALGARFTVWTGVLLWPADWPLLAQVPLAVLTAEAASYAIHRSLHESRLWPLHAVHHCSPRMYFLLVARKHPLQAFLTYGGRLSVLWLLGVPGDVLALYTVFTSTNGYVQHANLRTDNRWLSWIFATPELHRVHHSFRAEESHANFGDVLIVFDALFGTRREVPDPARLHTGLGLGGSPIGQRYVDHLRLPFQWKEHEEQARG